MPPGRATQSPRGPDKPRLLSLFEKIGCHLVDIIVQPVRVQCVRHISPGERRAPARIIVLVIMQRKLRVLAPPHVAPIFAVQGHAVVLRVTLHENLPPLLVRDEQDTRLLGLREDAEFRVL